jgi:hypothetical protein
VDVIPRGAYLEVTASLIRGPAKKDEDLLAKPRFVDVSKSLMNGSVDGPFRNFHVHQYGYRRGHLAASRRIATV